MANPIAGLTNLITGGANEKANADLENVLAQIQGIETPTAAQLQLSPLSQYYSTGDLSAALAQAAQTGPSAYNNENISSVPIDTMQQALAQEGEIANAKGMTPQEKAEIAQAEEEANRNLQGQRGAIAQDFAQRGIPQSLIAAALENANAGQDADAVYNAAIEAQGQAANQGITALANEQAGANTMYGNIANQANTVAAAQNALNQFNTANTQQVNLANQANTQASNVYNTQNKQNVANQNVTGANQVQYQNQVEAPQEAAGLALQKGNELAGIGENQAQTATAQGQQAAGLTSGLLGMGTTLGAAALLGPAAPAATAAASAVEPQYQFGQVNFTPPVTAASGGEIPEPKIPATNFKIGGEVPGRAKVAGNSPDNDTVHAMLSPGEVVLPRTVVQNPSKLDDFLSNKVPDMAQRMPQKVHPSDIASIVRALGAIRAGEA